MYSSENVASVVEDELNLNVIGGFFDFVHVTVDSQINTDRAELLRRKTNIDKYFVKMK